MSSLALLLAGGALAAAAWAQPHGSARLYVRPQPYVLGLWFNPESETFHDNPTLVRAIAYALDRPALIRTRGPFAGQPTALLIPPGVPGHGSRSPYPLEGADLDKAELLTGTGVLRDGSPTLAVNPAFARLADEVKHELAPIGLDVHVLVLAGVEDAHQPPLRIDFWIGASGPDYPDPAGAFPPGLRLRAPWAERLARAERTTGAARDAAFARLDYDLMTTDPPVLPFMVLNKRLLVSARVHCLRWNPWCGVDYAAVCLS